MDLKILIIYWNQLYKKKDSFIALLIIDELGEELETVLISRFKFPVEVITLKRYRNSKGILLYEFEPFLNEVSADTEKINIAEIDTIVVPARKDGFDETFIEQNCWYAIRLNSSMIPKIKYIAAYQIAPVSAITHMAEIKSIKQWKDTNKYILYFLPDRFVKLGITQLEFYKKNNSL